MWRSEPPYEKKDLLVPIRECRAEAEETTYSKVNIALKQRILYDIAFSIQPKEH